MQKICRLSALCALLSTSLCALPAAAAISSANILNNVTDQFHTQAAAWAGAMTAYAMNLFWALGTISLVWTGALLILKKADIGEFFAEFIRFILFFGFFLWLLRNAGSIGSSLINSMVQIGANASKTGATNPSAVMDIGFNIFHKVMQQTTIWSPTDSLIGGLLAAVILVCIALIAANMTIILCSGWILLYGGIFFLGFGGSRWTSEIAINYYRTLFSVAASLMAMVLVVGVAQNIVTTYYNQMSFGIDINEIATLMVMAIILLFLVHRLPAMITGILVGSHISNSGVGAISVGGFTSAAGVAISASLASGAITSAAAKNFANNPTIKSALQSLQQALGTAPSSQDADKAEGGLAESMHTGETAAQGNTKGTAPKTAANSNRERKQSGAKVTKPKKVSAANENDDEITAFIRKGEK